MSTHGLVIGKFYPLHAGHEHLVTTAADRCDRLTVVAMASSVGRPVMTTVTSAAPDSPNNQPCLSLLQSP